MEFWRGTPQVAELPGIFLARIQAELAGFESSYRGGIERQNRTKDRTRVLPCGFSREKHTNRRRSIPQQGNSELNQASDWNREHFL